MTAKTPERVIAEAIFNSNVGDTSDPELLAFAEGVATQTAKDAIAALTAAGFVIVPREPHKHMQVCGSERINDMAYFESDTDSAFAMSIALAVYEAMIDAAEEKPADDDRT